jgi:hypothetical protein
MCIIDDPMLALIVRFVVKDIDNLNISDETFLQHQITEIRRHIEKSPKIQQQQLALEWIKKYAEQYRQEWRRRTFSKAVLDKRCADCPLIHGSSSSFCIIHSKWVELLKEYIADEIGSDEYIEETLNLLEQNKANLKVSAINLNMQS